jgi:hypothetical protein
MAAGPSQRRFIMSAFIAAIPAASHPCKQVVRAYLRRCKDTCPPPPDEIRRELAGQG